MPEPSLSDRAAALISQVMQSTPGATPVQQAAWVSALAILGGIATACGLAVITWKIARPHVDKYVRDQIRPLQQAADSTLREVAINGGTSNPPTLKDDISDLRDHLGRVEGKVDTNTAALADHEAASGQYLGQVSLVLASHGIQLPTPPEDGDDQ